MNELSRTCVEGVEEELAETNQKKNDKNADVDGDSFSCPQYFGKWIGTTQAPGTFDRTMYVGNSAGPRRLDPVQVIFGGSSITQQIAWYNHTQGLRDKSGEI